MYNFKLRNDVDLDISISCFFEHLHDTSGLGNFVNNLSSFSRESSIDPLRNVYFPIDATKLEGAMILDRFADLAQAVKEDLHKKTGVLVRTMRMLVSHGSAYGGNDFHYDSAYIRGRGSLRLIGERRAVQDWIREYDGKYDALVISVCNSPIPIKLESKASILYYHKGLADDDSLRFGDNVEMCKPEIASRC